MPLWWQLPVPWANNMDTPICDFVREYYGRNTVRLHMPGHKGSNFLGIEHLDITEVNGADSLYEAEGIIRKSEENASSLFGCPTFYSTEGSSQCIRAMLYLAKLHALGNFRSPRILAARNVHKSFLSGCALLDLEVMWLYPENADSYLSCRITPEKLETILSAMHPKPAAVYLTSPDYLGNPADVAAMADICRKHGVLLLIDNAHGAYLRFLQPSQHPMDLGADLCCDSAHKTLPVLTGGAYLHMAPWLEPTLGPQVKNAMALFGSTSPSYLILQSLDAANAYLMEYPGKLTSLIQRINRLKEALRDAGYAVIGQEPLKITLSSKAYGYLGTELGDILRDHNLECEFSDPDFLVLMVTPENGEEDLQRVYMALMSIPRKPPVLETPPIPAPGKRAISLREAMLSASELIAVEGAIGRILASPSVGCPPAVPILVCGERIDSTAIACFQYYGIRQVAVVKENCPV